MSGFLFGSSSKTNTPPTPAAQLRIQTSIAGRPVPIGWGLQRLAGNLIWYGDFVAIPQSSPAASGGKGGGGSSQPISSYTYQAAVAIGLCEGPINGILSVWVQATAASLADYNLTEFSGAYGQGTWGYMDSLHPGESLDYRGLAYLAAGPMPLGSSDSLPSLTFEVAFNISTAYAGVPDADPSAAIADYLTNANYGAGFPSAFLGDLSLYRSYCLAAGLVVSDALTDQKAANTYLADLLAATNAEFVWASGLLTIVPYGDAGPIAGNGYSYTPPSVPLFSLGDDDFMKNSGTSSIGVSAYTNDDPVICVQKRRSDALNDVKVEYLDRTNAYNPTIVEAKDDASITAWGLRPSDVNAWHFFALASAATMSAQLQLARQQVLNQYTFTLDQRYIVLDPMDLIEISDAALGLVNAPVRIIEITENQEDSSLTFVVEDYFQQTTVIPAYGSQANAGFSKDINFAPGPVNAPLIFEPPVDLTGGALQVMIAASGSSPSLWGGCQVWISTDGATFRQIGVIEGAARQGVLAAPLPLGADPDLADTLTVDLTMSAGQLISGTQADADGDVTACWVANDAAGGEVVSYETATLTGASHYALTYLRRGQYATRIAAHAAGDGFARLDSAIFTYDYPSTLIGQTITVKLVGFNLYGGGLEDISTVTPYTYTILGPPAPPDVTGFMVSQNGNVVAFSWTPLTGVFGLKGYDIGYAPAGTSSWASFTMLTESAAGTEMTNAEVPPGSWVFGIRARDLAGHLSAEIATFDLTVIHEAGQAISAVEQAPDWPGAVSGFAKHPSGVLVPLDQYVCSHYTNYSDVTATVPNPVASATYTAPEVDTGYNDSLRVYSTLSASPLPTETGPVAGTGFAIDTWLTGASDPNSFSAWTIDYVTMRYLRGQLTYAPVPGSVGFVTEFTPIIDSAPTTETVATVAVSPGGTAVTFPAPFHIPPDITVSPVGSTAAYATASNITATGFTLWLWDDTGTSISGTATYSATGE